MKKTRISILALALCAGVFGTIGIANAQYRWHNGGYPYSDMPAEVQTAMQEHWKTVAPLREQLFAKQAELDSKIASGANDSEISSVTQEINNLNARLNEAHVQMRQEMAKQGMPYGFMRGYRGHRGGGYYGHGGPGCW